MSRFLSLLYGTVCYVMFLGVFLYAIGFVGNFPLPKTIDSGAVGSFGISLLIDLVLLGLFAVQHSVMARPGFKQWWTRMVPEQIERSTFVLMTNLILILLFWQWRPLPDYVWSTESDIVATILIVLSWAGWGIVLVGTFLIDHFDLFGMRQVVLYFQGEEYTHVEFVKRGFYKYVRHPLMLGFIIAFWATPDMSIGHLLFAVATTGYIILAIQLEEKDLISVHGDDYDSYRSEVSMLFPLRFGGNGGAAVVESPASSENE
ncbi:MAG: methanethiol S-methyltransferase [Rhodothermales bacterium]